MQMLQLHMHPIQAFSTFVDSLKGMIMLQQGSSQAGNGTRYTSNDNRCFLFLFLHMLPPESISLRMQTCILHVLRCGCCWQVQHVMHNALLCCCSPTADAARLTSWHPANAPTGQYLPTSLHIPSLKCMQNIDNEWPWQQEHNVMQAKDKP